MSILRTIAAGLVFTVAALTFLVSAVGVVGVWFVKDDVDNSGIAAIDLVSGYLRQAGQAVANADGVLAGVEQRLDTVRDGVERVRQEGPNGPAGQVLQRTLEGELLPSLDQMAVSAEQIRDGVGTLNESANRLNRIPGVTLPTVSADLEAVEQNVVGAVTSARELGDALRSLDVARITAGVEALDQRIGSVRSVLGTVSSRVTGAEGQLAQARSSLPIWTTVGTGTLSALLALFAAGQLSLAFHAWGWMRGARLGPVGARA